MSHAITDLAMAALRKRSDGKFSVDDAALAAVKQALASLFRTPALPDAAEALAQLGVFLANEKGSPAAGRAMLDVALLALPELQRMHDVRARQSLEKLRANDEQMASFKKKFFDGRGGGVGGLPTD